MLTYAVNQKIVAYNKRPIYSKSYCYNQVGQSIFDYHINKMSLDDIRDNLVSYYTHIFLLPIKIIVSLLMTRVSCAFTVSDRK